MEEADGIEKLFICDLLGVGKLPRAGGLVGDEAEGKTCVTAGVTAVIGGLLGEGCQAGDADVSLQVGDGVGAGHPGEILFLVHVKVIIGGGLDVGEGHRLRFGGGYAACSDAALPYHTAGYVDGGDGRGMTVSGEIHRKARRACTLDEGPWEAVGDGLLTLVQEVKDGGHMAVADR